MPEPKHPKGREGGIRTLASLRRQNLASVRGRHSPIEAQRERGMKMRAAGVRRTDTGFHPREQQTSSNRSKRPTKKPTR